MQFLATVALIALAAVAPATAAPLASPFMGVISAPAASTTLAAATPFDFDYAVSNWCEEGYNHFKVFVTSGSSAPTFDDLNEDGDVPNAVHSFGQFAVANFGLPAPSNPPPASLTMPSVSSDTIADGKSTFLTVVQIFTSCPGHVVQELGVTSVPFEYAASS